VITAAGHAKRLHAALLLTLCLAAVPPGWAQTQRPPTQGATEPTTPTPDLGETFRSVPSTDPRMLERTRFVSPEVLEAAIDAETYVLGPHDILAVMILAGQTRLERLPVLPEGVVVVPGVGAVPASGRTIVEFREALRRELSRHYQNFELYSYLAVARQVRVYVTGEVREPGTLVARPYERVSDVVERAGGFRCAWTSVPTICAGSSTRIHN
jgi:protein involved in polysaccharide export with SLBB domain